MKSHRLATVDGALIQTRKPGADVHPKGSGTATTHIYPYGTGSGVPASTIDIETGNSIDVSWPSGPDPVYRLFESSPHIIEDGPLLGDDADVERSQLRSEGLANR